MKPNAMKRTLLIPMIASAALWSRVELCRADPPEDLHTRVIDTTITLEDGQRFRLRNMPCERFDSLRRIYYVAPSEPIKDPAKVEKLLGRRKCRITYTTYAFDHSDDYEYGLSEVRYGRRLRVMIQESEGFIGYYPRERIFMYMGGHTSDQAFFIDTGEEAYNPEYSAFSADGRYRLTGMFGGQESVDYRIEKYDPARGKYVNLDSDGYILQKIIDRVDVDVRYYYIGYLGEVYDQFWVGNTLYFRTGGQSWVDPDDYPYMARYISVEIL